MLEYVEPPEETGELVGMALLDACGVGVEVGVTEELGVGVGQCTGAHSQRICFISCA